MCYTIRGHRVVKDSNEHKQGLIHVHLFKLTNQMKERTNKQKYFLVSVHSFNKVSFCVRSFMFLKMLNEYK